MWVLATSRFQSHISSSSRHSDLFLSPKQNNCSTYRDTENKPRWTPLYEEPAVGWKSCTVSGITAPVSTFGHYFNLRLAKPTVQTHTSVTLPPLLRSTQVCPFAHCHPNTSGPKRIWEEAECFYRHISDSLCCIYSRLFAAAMTWFPLKVQHSCTNLIFRWTKKAKMTLRNFEWPQRGTLRCSGSQNSNGHPWGLSYFISNCTAAK